MHRSHNRTMATPMVASLSLLASLLLSACSASAGGDGGNPPLEGGILSVSPLEAFAPSGPAGGPFTPSERTYTVTNLGATDLGWEAELSESWLLLSSGAGLLSAGESMAMTLSIDEAQAALLPHGVHTAALVFRGDESGGSDWDQTATIPITLTVDFVFEGELAVYPPDPFQAFGPEGGPFLPLSKTYTLVNIGGDSIDWSLANSQSWVSVSGTTGTIGAGDFQTVIVALTEDANQLIAGQHLGSLEFTNTTNGAGDTSIGLDLQISDVPAGRLTVLPDETFLASGQEGGPFAPMSKVYTLINTGGAALDWTAATSEPWTSVSPLAGTIEPGQQVPITVELDEITTAALAPGDHTATLTILNTTNGDGDTSAGVILTVEDIPIGTLAVFPAEDYLASGMEGGPFVPDSKTYTLINIGGQALDWDAACAQSWVSFLPANGTLQPDEQVVLTLSLDGAAAAGFSAGEYLSALLFTNTTNGAGDLAQEASLSVVDAGQPGSLRVFPLGPFDAQGFEGGPFSPASQSYTLMNVGGQDIDWSVTSTESWVESSQGTGTLSPTDQVLVFLALDQSHLATLPAGLESSPVSFVNLTNGDGDTSRTVTVQIDSPPAPGYLSVSPATDFISTGFEGGPFTPDSQVYTLSNTGSLTLEWSASSSVAWVSCFPSTGTLYPGQSQEVSFDLVSAQVDTFPSSAYQGLLSFVNTTDGSGGTSQNVTLTIDPPATPGTLDVAPTGDFTSVGPEGGPFVPPSHTWILSNTGSQPLDWQVSSSEPWVTLLPVSGQLLGGQTISVVGTIDPATANALVANNYTAQIDFANLTNGNGDTLRNTLLTVEGPGNPGSLSVTPATPFQANGPAGGPFVPDSTTYTLTNTGGAPLDWSCSPLAPWISIFPTSGTLQPGANTVLLASLESAHVTTFPPGSYSAAIDFLNDTDGTGDTQRNVDLTVDESGGGGDTNTPTIPPGTGWTGPTAEPGQVGSGPHDDAKVIGRWDVVPYQTVTDTFQVGIPAFHINQVDRVEFAVEGGAWVAADSMAYNPRTDVWEYYGVLRASDFASAGPIEVRAIAYPTVGMPRLLDALYLNVDPDDSLVSDVRYVSPTGSDSTGAGTQIAPFATIKNAAQDLTNELGSADGCTIYLTAGDHDYGGGWPYQPIVNSRWLTIRPAPGLTKADVRVTSYSGSLRATLVHVQDLTFRTFFTAGSSENAHVWVDDCHMLGDGPDTLIDNSGGHWLNPTQWAGNYITNTECEQNFHGFLHATLQRQVTVHDIASDAFHNGRLVLNCTAYDLDAGDTGAHVDIYQLTYRLPEEEGSPDVNCIYYGNRADDYNGQGIYFDSYGTLWNSTFDNVAIVNSFFNQPSYGFSRSHLSNRYSNHILFWNLTILNQKLDFNLLDGDGGLENISVRGCCLQRMTYGSRPGNTASVLTPHDVSDNHYIEGSSGYHNITPGDSASEGDPGLEDAGAGDYRPSPASVLVGRISSPLTPVDVDGIPRGAPTAIGALVNDSDG